MRALEAEHARPTVFVVDDDDAVRGALRLLMKSVGLPTQVYPSAQTFLSDYINDQPGCLVLDIRMPEMTGLELQRALSRRDAIIPIIFITGHGDVPIAVEAMRSGAVHFLQKPFREQDLIDCIHQALVQDAENRARLGKVAEIMAALRRLTARERQVLDMVLAGKLNKVIAAELDISERTVEVHRARMMEKMGASSLAHLIRMVALTQD